MQTPQVPAMQGMTPLGVKEKRNYGDVNDGEFVAALQHCKEEIGEFANGDGSPRAESAKKLWYALDAAQTETEDRIRKAGAN